MLRALAGSGTVDIDCGRITITEEADPRSPPPSTLRLVRPSPTGEVESLGRSPSPPPNRWS
ncbi:hypothetical protein AV521_30580 [Streptomyces sp. IMTB 2501]|uniref:hypothetical protein n=1 Tax=Streptomyces sp. IMTB 2501 TaxID=1776340 RepID=UPI00096D5269|nr:hypothetical protein [Streptomyces sp. IMTB 2501]OLZ65757.1 hypothetical protein AV521_30580 [Streptomyces sp. IMTB 2501]